MTAWLLVALPCLLGLFLYRWLLRHAGPWTFAAPKQRQVIRGQVEPPGTDRRGRNHLTPGSDGSRAGGVARERRT
jgi:hypothetical protein